MVAKPAGTATASTGAAAATLAEPLISTGALFANLPVQLPPVTNKLGGAAFLCSVSTVAY